MKSDLNQLLTADSMLNIAGYKFFERGEGYCATGAVEDIVESRGAIKATVAGTHDYKVKIQVYHNELDYICNCPVGQRGLFCKHLVATGLAWLQEQQGRPPVKNKIKNKTPNIFETIRGHLATLDKKQLINIVIEQAEDDAAFRNSLLTKALVKLPISERDLTEHKEFIRKAIQTSFVDYGGMYRYLQRVGPVYELIEQLYKQKHFEHVIELSAYALRLGFTAYNNVDDSDGGFGGVLDSFSDYHYQACHNSQPDKKRLAKSLFNLHMKDGWGLIDFRNYEKVLGKQGLDQFKTLAKKRWQKVSPKNTNHLNDYGSDDYNITKIMQQLAEMEDDIDTLIAIKKRDLSSSYQYFEIAEVYKKAKRYDEALYWAEKGLKLFKNEPNSPLVEFLITEYQRRKQHDKAIQLAWQELIRKPGLRDYQQLKACADKVNSWEHWHKKALQWLRKEYLPKLNNKNQNHWQWGAGGHSLLVEIFLWEKDLDSALAEAKQGGCVEHLWFALAKACKKSYPVEALTIYQDRIGSIIELTNNDAYNRATDMLKIIKKLMQQLKQQSQFEKYIEQLRKDYKQKRNFIKKIEKL